MSDPFIGEIQAFAFDFGNGGINPFAWLPCDGRLLSISQYSALFALIGTYYGGDGTRTFALPNLNGRVALGQGTGGGLTPRSLGQSFGSMTHTLSVQELPFHDHALVLGNAAAPGATPGPGAAGTTVALNPAFNGFVSPPTDTALATTAVAMDGGNQGHPNNQPTLAMYYCIATTGIFPTFG